jgi:hypothetical protein
MWGYGVTKWGYDDGAVSRRSALHAVTARGVTMGTVRRMPVRALSGDAVGVVARVGVEPEQRLSWLGEFIDRDLADVDSQRQAATELTTWLYLEFTQPLRSGGGHKSRLEVQPTKQVDVTEVLELQRLLRDVLGGLTPDRSLALDRAPISVGAIGTSLFWNRDRGIVLETRSAGAAQVVGAAASLLMAIGPQLRRCTTESCQKLFAANRPFQQRCTKACGTTARVKAWRAKHSDRHKETRHQQYVKRVTARLPGVRVGRHKTRRNA